jgi:DNA-binding HxlR family transcriptional regulator
MPLPKDYPGQNCAIARSLEVVGERWTLLIVRDLFYGVRHYNDLRRHLAIPPAVLRDRLNHLVVEGVVQRTAGPGAYHQYTLTKAGVDLWPVVWSLLAWGDRHRSSGTKRVFIHALCGRPLHRTGQCSACQTFPAVKDIVTQLPPRSVKRLSDADEAPLDKVAGTLRQPHRLLSPI